MGKGNEKCISINTIVIKIYLEGFKAKLSQSLSFQKYLYTYKIKAAFEIIETNDIAMKLSVKPLLVRQ